MDSLTQIALGAAVGEAVLGKKLGNKAMLYGAIAGTIPDLDVLLGKFTDVVTALEIHRGLSHSILFALILAPILGWLVGLYEKKTSWKALSWLFFLGLFTHSLLDARTSWGTQLFWPLDYTVAHKNIFVIDPLYTLPLILGLILAIRQKPESLKRRRYNRWGLILSSGYMVTTLLFKGIAYQKFENALHVQGIQYSELETKPTPLNSILWAANVQTDDAFLIGYYSLFDTQPIVFSSYPKNHHLLEELNAHEKVKRMITISENWYTITKQDEQLVFNDLRYGTLSIAPDATNFVFSYQIDKTNKGISFTERPKDTKAAKQLLSQLWNRLLGH